MEQNTSLALYRQQIDKDLHFLYIFNLLVCAADFTVGIIWQNIDISAQNSGNLLELPYFGCQITLASLAIRLVFVYNLISLENDMTNMKYLRRFQLVLSVIVLVATVALTIILSIRANDYRQSKQQLTRIKYGTAIFFTVITIILTIFALPVYLYLVMIDFNSVKLAPDDKEDQQTLSDVEQGEEEQQNGGNIPRIGQDENRVSCGYEHSSLCQVVSSLLCW